MPLLFSWRNHYIHPCEALRESCHPTGPLEYGRRVLRLAPVGSRPTPFTPRPPRASAAGRGQFSPRRISDWNGLQGRPMPQYVRPQKLREEQGWFDPPQLVPAPRSPEDLHGGGQVNGGDLALILSDPTEDRADQTDPNGDGIFNGADMPSFLGPRKTASKPPGLSPVRPRVPLCVEPQAGAEPYTARAMI